MKFKLFLLCVLFTSAFGSSSFAEEKAAAITAEKAEDLCMKDSETSSGAALKRCIMDYLGAGSGVKNTSLCSTKMEEYKTAQKEFSTQCKAGGVGGSNCESVAITCGCAFADENDAACENTISGNVEKFQDRIDAQDEELEDLAAGDRYSSKKNKSIPYFQLAQCKPAAKARLPQVKEDLKDLRKDVSSKEESLAEAQGEIRDAQNALQVENDEFEAALSELTESLDDKKTKLNEELTAQNEADLNSIRQLRNEITKLERKLVELEVQKAVEKAKIAQICEDLAEKQIQNVNTQKNAAAIRRSQNLKALTSLKITGRTSTTEKERQKRINSCRQDPAKYNEPMSILQQKFEGLKGDIAAQLGMIVDEIEQKSMKIAGSGEKDTTAREAAEKKAKALYEKIYKTHATKAGVCTSEVQGQQQNQDILKVLQAAYKKGKKNPDAAKEDSCTGLKGKILAANQKAARLTKELSEDKEDLAYNQKFEAAIVEAGGNGTISKDFDESNLTGAYDDLTTAKDYAVTACCANGSGEDRSLCDDKTAAPPPKNEPPNPAQPSGAKKQPGVR